MRRREFIAGLGVAAVLPKPAAALGKVIRRVGVLSGLSAGDPHAEARLAALIGALKTAGWEEGRNLEINIRYTPGVAEGAQNVARDFLSLRPEVVLAQGLSAWTVRNLAPDMPIVFVGVPDPIRFGFVNTLARPGGTLTGFTSTEPSIGAKWLGLLREVSPSMRHATVMVGGEMGMFGPNIVAAGEQMEITVRLVALRGTSDIDPALAEAAEPPGAGLILPTDIFTTTHRRLIIEGALRRGLPLVTGNPPYPRDGGLLYYGADFVDLYRRAADYIARILSGAKPADLPIQQPTIFQLSVNLKSAKALGLTIPPSILATADEVIE